jgi:hypothetical protein
VLDDLVDRLGALRLPSRRVFALLVLAFFGFGLLLGNVARSRGDYTLAASARPLKLVLPAATTPAATTPGGDVGAGEVEAASSEPPEAVAEPTPEASAPVEATPASAPASKPGGSKQSETDASSGAPGKSPSSKAGVPATKLPAIDHVFVIMLSDQPYAAVFGPESAAPYLAHTLEQRGELLARLYGVAHQQLANGIALLSGQGPTAATAANCPIYEDLTPATPGGEEQVLGDGCVYPATTPTLPGQLEVKHRSWRAYVQGIDEPGSVAGACAHPAPGALDPSAAVPPPAASYATFRNPFVYFHSLIDAPSCARDDVGLSALSADLQSAKRTPSFSYIVPDRCHDASPGPCPGGGAGGPAAADELLKQVVPKILASQAYKHGGLLVITVDQAPSSGEFADSSSCCSQPRFPNLPAPAGAAAALGPEGGGQVGALLLSPFVKGGVITQAEYNQFSLLRTFEDLFSLKHLGYAAGAKVKSLEPSLFRAKPAG